MGKGGSSKVYKVLASNNRIFALKRVSFERADKVTIEGYVNEINLLQKLEKNSRIVRLYDAEINNQKGALSLVWTTLLLHVFLEAALFLLISNSLSLLSLSHS